MNHLTQFGITARPFLILFVLGLFPFCESARALKPVTFHYKTDRNAAPRYGLVAEDVAAVNPHLVTRNKNAEIIGVQYDQVWNMLLNEFLKEHSRGEEQDCKIEEQETTIAELRSEVRHLAALVSDQASQMRKVNAQLQISGAAAQEIASNSP